MNEVQIFAGIMLSGLFLFLLLIHMAFQEAEERRNAEWEAREKELTAKEIRLVKERIALNRERIAQEYLKGDAE